MIKIVKSKRSQLTLFIIVAIVIVAVLIILFYPKLKRVFMPSTPSVQLGECIKNKLNEAIELVSKRGGSVEPVNAIMFGSERIEYLCYTNQYYKTCVMQQPLLRQHIEREILDYVKPQTKQCVENLKKDLEKKGYSISGIEDVSVSIVPNNVKIVVSGFSAVKGDTGESYKKFVVEKKSKLYSLIMLTASILNWEARYGDSDITAYMIYYPNVKVEKYKQSDGSKIYILTDSSRDKFIFATRSLSWPAGYGFGQTYKPVIV
jgi:hypothetical protein